MGARVETGTYDSFDVHIDRLTTCGQTHNDAFAYTCAQTHSHIRSLSWGLLILENSIDSTCAHEQSTVAMPCDSMMERSAGDTVARPTGLCMCGCGVCVGGWVWVGG